MIQFPVFVQLDTFAQQKPKNLYLVGLELIIHIRCKQTPLIVFHVLSDQTVTIQELMIIINIYVLQETIVQLQG
jgi:hypothetical protein